MSFKIGDKVKFIGENRYTRLTVNSIYEVSKVSLASVHIQVKGYECEWLLSKKFILATAHLPDELFQL